MPGVNLLIWIIILNIFLPTKFFEIIQKIINKKKDKICDLKPW